MVHGKEVEPSNGQARRQRLGDTSDVASRAGPAGHSVARTGNTPGAGRKA